MNLKLKLLILIGVLGAALIGREVSKNAGRYLGERLFGPIPQNTASERSSAPKAWPEDEVALSAAIQSIPFTVIDRKGHPQREVTWVGTQTIQRADETCVQITRDNPRISADGKSQKISVSETIAHIDCPTLKEPQL